MKLKVQMGHAPRIQPRSCPAYFGVTFESICLYTFTYDCSRYLFTIDLIFYITSIVILLHCHAQCPFYIGSVCKARETFPDVMMVYL